MMGMTLGHVLPAWEAAEEVCKGAMCGRGMI